MTCPQIEETIIQTRKREDLENDFDIPLSCFRNVGCRMGAGRGSERFPIRTFDLKV